MLLFDYFTTPQRRAGCTPEFANNEVFMSVAQLDPNSAATTELEPATIASDEAAAAQRYVEVIADMPVGRVLKDLQLLADPLSRYDTGYEHVASGPLAMAMRDASDELEARIAGSLQQHLGPFTSLYLNAAALHFQTEVEALLPLACSWQERRQRLHRLRQGIREQELSPWVKSWRRQLRTNGDRILPLITEGRR
jgi:hypothetical protein